MQKLAVFFLIIFLLHSQISILWENNNLLKFEMTRGKRKVFSLHIDRFRIYIITSKHKKKQLSFLQDLNIWISNKFPFQCTHANRHCRKTLLLSSVWIGFSKEFKFKSTHANTYWKANILFSNAWIRVFTEFKIEKTHADAQRREAIFLWIVWINIYAEFKFKSTYANTHWRETIFL